LLNISASELSLLRRGVETEDESVLLMIVLGLGKFRVKSDSIKCSILGYSSYGLRGAASK